MKKLADLSPQEIAPLLEDAYRNIASHSGLWFGNACDEFGLEEAIRLDQLAWKAGFPIRSGRVLATLGLKEGKSVSTLFSDWSKEQLIAMLEDLAKNWLAADGAWFQAVESSHSMALAKKLNDAAWSKFTVIEAKRIMERLQLPQDGGLLALGQALEFRLYARINKQETLWQGKDKLVFRMNDCRVQSARERKGMAAYPCKSAGIVEYSYFARTIDPRIQTRCIGCPPDPHPPEYYCAWEFQLG
ncbi:MAG: cytosolic protein [Chloroflexi bacterium]|nr:cytosolic protein [Chloroflexota bacterium]MBM4452645.1 cytosolic protein [Chloroflexota bacterium]MBM4453413.1 cytosolic protein [Chloroflexota bacterium]